MMCWNRQWVVSSKSLQWVPVEEEQMDQTEGTDVVPAKNPSKVKLVNEISKNSIVRELGISYVPVKGGGLVLI